MGMDLYGINPVNETGMYFRGNIAEWHPLWRTICDLSNNVLSKKQKKLGHQNRKMLITKNKTEQLTRAIESYVTNNNIVDFSKLNIFYNKYQKNCKNDPIIKQILNSNPNCGLHISINSSEDFIKNFMLFYMFLKKCGGFQIS